MAKEKKFYTIRSKRGLSAVVTIKPKPRKQDLRFSPHVFYAVVFFPKITGIGKAVLYKHTLHETLSSSREAAVSKFMDGKPKGEIWENYRRAGWKVRRIRVSDLGSAKNES